MGDGKRARRCANRLHCFVPSLTSLVSPGYINAEVWPPASWTTAIIAWIRKYDTKHLIIDGELRGLLLLEKVELTLRPFAGTNGFWNCVSYDLYLIRAGTEL